MLIAVEDACRVHTSGEARVGAGPQPDARGAIGVSRQSISNLLRYRFFQLGLFMPEFRVSPLSIVNQIKSNLRERYRVGFPILKELLQNADDAKARRFMIDALPGWPTAANPLLQGPGLLVVNDSVFRLEDERNIVSFGESSKATDSAVIGRFGIGQKAVFHFCDAFAVYAHGDHEPFRTVVNPFLNVEVEGNITRDWESLSHEDLELLRDETSANFPNRCFALWLPFRREGLQPAPGTSFSSDFPSASRTVGDLVKLDRLRVILTALRHLKSIEIRECRRTNCILSVTVVSIWRSLRSR